MKRTPVTVARPSRTPTGFLAPPRLTTRMLPAPTSPARESARPGRIGALKPSPRAATTSPGDVATVPEPTRDAREAFPRQSGGASVDEDPTTGSVRSVSRTDGLLTGPSNVDDATIALDYVRSRSTLFGIDDADLASLSLAARYTSPNAVTHLTWQQTSRGLKSYDGLLTVNVARDGRVVNVTGSLVHGLDPGSTSCSRAT